MPFWRWSTTSASNGNADPSINFLEGQAPSSLNDSMRATMSALRMWGNDISGALVTGGGPNAYTVTSSSGYDTLPHLNGQVIAFSPHATNGAGPVTLSVDGLTAKPLRSAPSTELLAGALIQGTPYTCLYNDSDGAFYLGGFFGNSYNIPLGGLLGYTGTTPPNSSFVLPFGQAISRTTYSNYFSLVSTTYGPGDGSTTFNVPDLRGRVPAGKDDMGGSAASRLSGTSITTGGATTIGGSGGGETKTLATGNLPTFTPSGSISNGGISISHNAITGSTTTGGGGFPAGANNGATINASQAGSTFTGNSIGSGTAFSVVQPTLILNFILRVL
jgi:microcystin-dependent protein